MNIWSSRVKKEDWIGSEEDKEEFLRECKDIYGSVVDTWTEEDIENEIYKLNDEYFEAEMTNLDIDIPETIVVFGTLGLWDGVKHGLKVCNKNIADAIKSIISDDYNDFEILVDENNDLICKDYHHDGTNHFLFRKVNFDVDVDKLEEDFVFTNDPDKLIDKKTKSLHPDLKKIYG